MRRAVRRVVAVEGGRGCGGKGSVMSCKWGGWLVWVGGGGGGGFTGIGSEVVGFFATTTSSSSSFSEGASTTTTAAAAVVADGGMVWFGFGGGRSVSVWLRRTFGTVDQIIVKQLGKGLWGEVR